MVLILAAARKNIAALDNTELIGRGSSSLFNRTNTVALLVSWGFH